MDITRKTRRSYRLKSDKRMASGLGGIAEFWLMDTMWLLLSCMLLFLLIMSLSGCSLFIAGLIASCWAYFVISAVPRPVASISLKKNF